MRPPPEGSSSQPKPTRKTKPRKQESEKASRLSWEETELLALAKCWIAVSEDPHISTNQVKDTFWYRVMGLFNEEWGFKRRTKDALTGKWDAIRKKVLVFNGIYSQLLQTGRASGTSDADVQTSALVEYKCVQGHVFPYLLCWEFLKDKQKFFNPDPCVVGRRNRRRDDGLTMESPFDLDEDEDEGREDGNERQRPPGRPRPQKSQKTTSSSATGTGGSSSSSIHEKAAELSTKKAELISNKLEAGLRLQRVALSKQRLQDFEFLSKETPAHLPEAARAVIEEQKARILEKLQNGYYDDV